MRFEPEANPSRISINGLERGPPDITSTQEKGSEYAWNTCDMTLRHKIFICLIGSITRRTCIGLRRVARMILGTKSHITCIIPIIPGTDCSNQIYPWAHIEGETLQEWRREIDCVCSMLSSRLWSVESNWPVGHWLCRKNPTCACFLLLATMYPRSGIFFQTTSSSWIQKAEQTVDWTHISNIPVFLPNMIDTGALHVIPIWFACTGCTQNVSGLKFALKQPRWEFTCAAKQPFMTFC